MSVGVANTNFGHLNRSLFPVVDVSMTSVIRAENFRVSHAPTFHLCVLSNFITNTKKPKYAVPSTALKFVEA